MTQRTIDRVLDPYVKGDVARESRYLMVAMIVIQGKGPGDGQGDARYVTD